MRLPKNVKLIIEKLNSAGFEAYAVGGCVRDSLLGKEPNDWDITTSAKPEQVKAVFKRTIDTGIEHGTVTVMLDHVGYEVTTYRIDGEYEDGRHPKQVIFTPNLLEDLKRRDFTINAMAYNDETGIVDEFDGMKDLEHHVIRCVGEPEERFREDALRMMRAVRFSGQLGYKIEDKTFDAIKELAPTIRKVSAERINVELSKLLVSNHPENIRFAYETGLTKEFLPEFDAIMETKQNNPHHIYSVGEHTIVAMQNVEADKILRLTMLIHDMGKAQTKKTDEQGIDHFHGHANVSAELGRTILKRLRFDNDTLNKVCKLVKYHDLDIVTTPEGVRRAIVKLGEDLFPYLLQVKKADFMAQSMYERERKQKKLDEILQIYNQVCEEKNCVTLKDLAMKGNDLVAAGIKPGKEIGEILNLMLDEVLKNPEHNTKEYLTYFFNNIHKIG